MFEVSFYEDRQRLTMAKNDSSSFHEFYFDEANVSPAQRAEIDLEVELIGKLIEAGESERLALKKLAV